MPNPENLKGKGFESRPENINRNGRPKKVLTKYKEMGYTKSQVRDTYAAISGLTTEEIQDVLNDDSSTVLEKTLAQTFLNAMTDGQYKDIKDIIELFADKAIQGVNVSTEKEIEIKVKYVNEGL